MSLLEAIMSVLFDPTSAFWKYLLVAMAGVMIGATAVIMVIQIRPSLMNEANRKKETH